MKIVLDSPSVLLQDLPYRMIGMADEIIRVFPIAPSRVYKSRHGKANCSGTFIENPKEISDLYSQYRIPREEVEKSFEAVKGSMNVTHITTNPSPPKKRLHVMIAGTTAAGATALANHLHDTLKQNGVKDVQVFDRDARPSFLPPLSALADREICISTTQLPRPLAWSEAALDYTDHGQSYASQRILKVKLPEPAEFIPLNFEVDTSLEYRKKMGLCPKCGEKGPYINCAPTCSKHGVY